MVNAKGFLGLSLTGDDVVEMRIVVHSLCGEW